MSSTRFQQTGRQIRLNVVQKNNQSLRISIIVGSGLTISHLKRKIETQFNQLYNIEIVVRIIQDSNGFVVSNNSNVDAYFTSGDTIYFQQHQKQQKSNSFNMNLTSNIGEVLSTVKYVTGSALEKLDKIDLSITNTLQIVGDFLHLGLWYSNPAIVKRLLKIFNKIFYDTSIQAFITNAPEIQFSLLLRIFAFWLIQAPQSLNRNPEIIWQLLQLLQKMTCNEKFIQTVKNNKIMKVILQISKMSTDFTTLSNVDSKNSNFSHSGSANRQKSLSSDIKKLAISIIRNVNNTGSKNKRGGMNKIQSSYIPTALMLGNSNINGYDIQDILNSLTNGSQQEKLAALQNIAESNYQIITQATVRYDFYQKLINLFTLRKFKSRKHMTMFSSAVKFIINNSNNEKMAQIMQKDKFIHKIHQFLLQAPVQLQAIALQYFGKVSKSSSASGVFNVQKSIQYLNSPYPQFQKIVLSSILKMAQTMNNNPMSVSSIRFVPGIRDFIKLSLKLKDQETICLLLKILSNLTLDQQCRYQIIHLKGIEVFIKFLETSYGIVEICRTCGKGLLNIAISSRENKAKVLGLMNDVLEIFYKGNYDSITSGFIQTILKSKNI